MRHYPIFLDLKDRPVLVVGAGKVAPCVRPEVCWKRARVSPWLPRSAARNSSPLPVRIVPRRFRARDLSGVLLVFAATDDRLTNHRIAHRRPRRGLFANIADSAEECDFLVPARFTAAASRSLSPRAARIL